MKKIYALFFLVLMSVQFGAFAERINVPGLAVPKLIITEVRPDDQASAYVEITNMGDTAINLEPFTLHSVFYNTRCTEYSDSAISFNRLNSVVDGTIGKIFLKGVLQPGESFVVANVWDTKNARGLDIPRHNTAIAQIGNQFGHRDERFNENGWIDKPEWQCFGRDSVTMDPTYNATDQKLWGTETAGYLLHWVYTTDSATVDSTYIDQFNHFFYPDENAAIGFNGSSKGPWIFPIAGIVDAMTTSVMVRKANVSKGNLNWNQSRGTDATTSEWLVIPKNTSQQLAFTTVGIHGGVHDLDYTAKDPSKIMVNDGASTISVPWEMIRGDSLSRYFNLGDGMGWSYDQVDIFADSASYIARPGDKFAFYAVGNEVMKKEYTLDVREAESDVALVFPRRRLVEEIEIIDDGSGSASALDTIITIGWSNGFAYALSEGPEMDSIINVSYATRTDSLLKYLDKPEKASWEFVFVDGIERVDLMFGDILKVTSEDGTTMKEYIVSVNDHVQSENVFLSTVTWPDIDKTRYPRWNVGDTLPEFTPLKTQYNVELRFDEKQIPAFQFKTQDLRATVKVKNAVDIDGTREQRTTSVTVTAENDTLPPLTYQFVFERQGSPVQPNLAEPFISEMIWNVTTQGCAFELFNPGTDDLDLSRYMYVAGGASQTWQEAVGTLVSDAQYTSGDGIKIYQTHYVPSKRWAADGSQAEWSAIPDEENPYVGKGFLKDDNQTDPWVNGNDVWVAGVTTKDDAYQGKIRQESDFLYRGPGEYVFAWDSTKILHRETPIWNDPRHNMWLLKVLNDSILDGTMDVRDASQYQLIDRFEMIGDSLAGRKTNSPGRKGWTLIRKAHVTEGNLDRVGGGTETAESSEWIVHHTSDSDWNNTLAVSNIGIHTFNPVTNYLSTVTSLKLIVTPGYRGTNLSITGNVTDYNPTTMTVVLDKADSTQTFVFKRGATELSPVSSIADGDVLEVTSGDGKNTTIYKLINEPLDDDTSLMAKAGSDLSVSGNTVSGATVGMTLRDAIAQLEVAEKSILNILDASGALQPLALHNLDSMINDVLVSEDIMLQVVAENNDNETYYFDFGLGSNGAVLLSNILIIDQENKRIMEFPMNSTVASMLSMIFANNGASVRILDKSGLERVDGFLNIDDVVEVTAADGVTIVTYGFDEGMFPVSVNPGIDKSSIEVVIFPNPVNNVLNVKGIELSMVQVYSIAGTMMINEISSYGNRLDVSSLPHGIYIIKMTDEKGRVAVDKFLKN